MRHSVRDRDIDDEFMMLAKERPALVVVPNLPDRGVVTDLSWLAESVPAGELSKLQAAATNRPGRSAGSWHSGQKPGKAQ